METVISMNGIPKRDGPDAVAVKDRSGVIAGPNYGDIPVRTLCPACRRPVMSQVVPTIGLGTWLLALVLLLLPPLCFLPFFINACKDKEHKCPNCGNILGVSRVVG